MFPDVLKHDHAVQIYKTDDYKKITFSVSKYPAGTFGELLKKLRLEKGLSQKELAEKIQVNEMSVVGWEKNLRQPKGRNVSKITNFFKTEKKRILEMLKRTGQSIAN